MYDLFSHIIYICLYIIYCNKIMFECLDPPTLPYYGYGHRVLINMILYVNINIIYIYIYAYINIYKLGDTRTCFTESRILGVLDLISISWNHPKT